MAAMTVYAIAHICMAMDLGETLKTALMVKVLAIRTTVGCVRDA